MKDRVTAALNRRKITITSTKGAINYIESFAGGTARKRNRFIIDASIQKINKLNELSELKLKEYSIKIKGRTFSVISKDPIEAYANLLECLRRTGMINIETKEL
jgi:hypothetical protein